MVLSLASPVTPASEPCSAVHCLLSSKALYSMSPTAERSVSNRYPTSATNADLGDESGWGEAKRLLVLVQHNQLLPVIYSSGNCL
jgi:hypothetical protein